MPEVLPEGRTDSEPDYYLVGEAIRVGPDSFAFKLAGDSLGWNRDMLAASGSLYVSFELEDGRGGQLNLGKSNAASKMFADVFLGRVTDEGMAVKVNK
jgi:hypothetical protein